MPKVVPQRQRIEQKGRLLQNVLGGLASGPVPKAGGFWFFNYQGIRGRNAHPTARSLSPIIQNFPTNRWNYQPCSQRPSA